MAWTLGTVLVGKDGDTSMLDDAGVITPGSNEEAATAAMNEAKKAVRALLKSGKFGGGQWRIMVNGSEGDDSSPAHVQIGIVIDDAAEVPTDLEMRLSRPETHEQAKAELLGEAGAAATPADAVEGNAGDDGK